MLQATTRPHVNTQYFLPTQSISGPQEIPQDLQQLLQDPLHPFKDHRKVFLHAINYYRTPRNFFKKLPRKYLEASRTYSWTSIKYPGAPAATQLWLVVEAAGKVLMCWDMRYGMILSITWGRCVAGAVSRQPTRSYEAF